MPVSPIKSLRDVSFVQACQRAYNEWIADDCAAAPSRLFAIGATHAVTRVGRFDETIEFNAFELFYAEKNFRGSMYGSADVRTDFHRLLRLWRAGRLDLEGMISVRSGLDGINEAFRAMKAGEVIRTVIEF